MLKNYYLGCPMWGNKDWQGSLFTKKAKPRDYLPQYAQVFNTVEANSTFYSMPRQEWLNKWRQETPEYFRFSFKLPKIITHDYKLRDVAAETQHFFEQMEVIAEKVGQYFIQLPPSFNKSGMRRLEQFLPLLPSGFTYSLEVRHLDFYDEDKQENRLNDLLEKYQINRAHFDTVELYAINATDGFTRTAQTKKPRMPRRLNATAQHPFLRYIGHRDIEPNETQIQLLATQTIQWMKEGKTPFIFMHSPGDEFAPQLARRFHEVMRVLTTKIEGAKQVGEMPVWPGDQERSRPKQLRLFD